MAARVLPLVLVVVLVIDSPVVFGHDHENDDENG
jgi:hypothetical protein